MRQFVIAAALILSPAAIASDQASLLASIPEGRTLTFKAYTGDTELGTHKMRWTINGDAVIATVEIDLGAKVLFLPVYSYKHRSQETWRNGALAAIDTATDDDGTKEFVKGEIKGAAFNVKSTLFNGDAPLPLAPSSYWHYGNLKSATWLNTQTGAILKIAVTPKGLETVKTRIGTMQARRYDITGPVDLSLWYDRKNHWVKTRFVASGNTITYVLQ